MAGSVEGKELTAQSQVYPLENLLIIVLTAALGATAVAFHRHWLALIPLLAAIYALGTLVSVARLRRRAAGGNRDAAATLARIFMARGRFCSSILRNQRRALNWWRMAAGQGHPEAQFLLGAAYDYGDGATLNKVEAFRWYRMAADQGQATAQFTIGTMYLLGEGVPANKGEAAKWYRKAAEQGDVDSQIALGTMCCGGDGVEESLGEAIRWYSGGFKASTLTKALAERYGTAFRWYLQNADKGDAEAMLNAGNIYFEGKTVAQDYVEALRWYSLAAEQGNDTAMAIIGHMYEGGKGVPIDFGEAMRWYRMSAEKGNAGAMFNIAVMYNRSKGVALDGKELYFWYTLSSSSETLPIEQAKGARKACEVLEKKLDSVTLTEIRTRVLQWKESHPEVHL